MYKVFVVDDEDWIRQRLIETVDWASIGAEVAGEASDGQSALEKIRELKPDIVLTDICMPEDDGLSLIEKINALSISVKIIIISGYDYFEYTKSAIKLGAFSYILKPVDDGELLKTAAEAIKELEKSRKKEDILRRLEEQVKEQLPFQREKFYDNLLHGYLKNSRWAYDEMELLGIKNKGCGHICLAIEPDRKFSDDTGPAEVHRFKYLVANIAEDFLKKIGEYEILFSRSDEVVCAVSSELTDGMTEERFKKRVTAAAFGIANMVRRLLDGTVTIGIGNPVDDLIKLNHSFEEAETALSYRNFLGENGIYNVEAADKYVQPVTCDSYDIESLCQKVRDADAQGALSCLDKILDEFVRENPNSSPIHLKVLFMDIVFHLAVSANNAKSLEEKAEMLDVGFFNRMYSIKSAEEIKSSVKELITTLVERRINELENGKRLSVEKAIEYIEKHYAEPIKLSDVANEIYLNPSYFCKIFKLETGESFVKYLTRYRIDKAKELLMDPKYKVYEVAEMTGYSDVQYFSKIFKSVTGVVPTYYRDRVK